MEEEKKMQEAVEDKRPSWDEYFMEMAELTAQRSTCLRRPVGAVIVRDMHAMATGYNGAPKGLKHCAELGGCLREKLHVPSGERHELCRALHAEQNAIIQAAALGQSIEGGTIYILGGTGAVPEEWIEGFEGYRMKRLSGSSRYTTNLEVLREAGIPEGSEILIATGENFADSLSASSTGKPILLVKVHILMLGILLKHITKGFLSVRK